MTKMTLSSSKLTLYPANWLYNAGVVGFLRVLDAMGEDVEGMLRKDGGVEVEREKFSKIFSERANKEKPLDILAIWHWYFIEETFKSYYLSLEEFIFSQITKIPKGAQKSQIRDSILKANFKFDGVSFDEEIKLIKEKFKGISEDSSESELRRISEEIRKIIKPKEDFYKYRKVIGFLFSSGGYYQNLFNPSHFKKVEKFVEKFNYDEIFKQNSNQTKCFFCTKGIYKVFPVDLQFMSYLFPAPAFPNSYWNLQSHSAIGICTLCKFLIVHHHLSLINLPNNSQIFINAPSFKIMWYLNRYAREIYGREKAERVEQILSMSLIEMTLRLNRELSRWTAMNIEVVLKRGDEINFFSLPYEVVRIITNRKVASLLSRINRYDVLNLVLKGDFEGILRMGERMLREGVNSRNKGEIRVSQKLFQLYAAISDVLKEEVEYDRYNQL